MKTNLIVIQIIIFHIIVISNQVCIGQSAKSNPNSLNYEVFGSKDKIPFSLTGDIFYLPKGTQNLPKKFDTGKSKGKIHVNELNIPKRSFKNGFPGITKRNEWFAIDYHGFFYMNKPEKLIFALNSDDGSKLYIDDHLVINNDGQHAAHTKYGTVALNQGVHKINVQYFQGPRDGIALVLKYKNEDKADFIPFNCKDFSPVNIIKPVSEEINIIDESVMIEPADSLVFTIEINSMVLFDLNQFTLKTNAAMVLNEIYKTYAKEKPNMVFIIEGHTDDDGTEDYNQVLSEKRAQSVADYLLASFAMENRIETIGFGESKPKAPNNCQANKAKNRRVEIQVMDSSKVLNYLKSAKQISH